MENEEMTSQDHEPKRLNVIMPQSEYRKLKQFALDQDITVSDVVRVALAAHMHPDGLQPQAESGEMP